MIFRIGISDSFAITRATLASFVKLKSSLGSISGTVPIAVALYFILDIFSGPHPIPQDSGTCAKRNSLVLGEFLEGSLKVVKPIRYFRLTFCMFGSSYYCSFLPYVGPIIPSSYSRKTWNTTQDSPCTFETISLRLCGIE